MASIVRQTEQLEIAYGQYKAPLQQFLKEALRAKAEEEEARSGEEDALKRVVLSGCGAMRN